MNCYGAWWRTSAKQRFDIQGTVSMDLYGTVSMDLYGTWRESTLMELFGHSGNFAV